MMMIKMMIEVFLFLMTIIKMMMLMIKLLLLLLMTTTTNTMLLLMIDDEQRLVSNIFWTRDATFPLLLTCHLRLSFLLVSVLL